MTIMKDARARFRVAQVESSDALPTPRKRSSARASGARYQLKIKKFLEERGYEVQNIPTKSYFIPQIGRFRSGRNDIFGCDLIAKRNDRETLWIQATKHKSLKEKIKVLSRFQWTKCERVLIFIHRGTGKDDIYLFLPDPEYQRVPLKIGWIMRKKLTCLQREAFYLFDPRYQ